MSKNKDLLISVGLNDLEADVYMLLLQGEALTGYKIGKALGKPTANVYKAIESLAKKGAVIIEDEKSSQCKGVSIIEFCESIEAGIKRKTLETKKAFNKPKNETYDEKNYQVQSADLVFEKSRQMLKSCSTIVMLDAFPKVVDVLMDDITDAIKRGIEVYLQVYEDVQVKGANMVLIDAHATVLEYWKSQQLNLVIDGKEHILALLSENLEEVYQATWSRNLYLSSMLHMGFSNHFAVWRIKQIPPGPEYSKQVKKILQKQTVLSSGKVPGVEEMLNRFRDK
jgi:sugar-specific transcriptional regulator TrmB